MKYLSTAVRLTSCFTGLDSSQASKSVANVSKATESKPVNGRRNPKRDTFVFEIGNWVYFVRANGFAPTQEIGSVRL